MNETAQVLDLLIANFKAWAYDANGSCTHIHFRHSANAAKFRQIIREHRLDYWAKVYTGYGHPCS